MGRARGKKVSGLDTRVDSFTEFAQEAAPRLRRALVAAYGEQEGQEGTAEAMAYAWEHWDRIRTMDNPIGYLYKVGRTRGLWGFQRPARLPRPTALHGTPRFEPSLPAALERLSPRQRAAVLLVKGYGWTLREVADLLGVSPNTVHKHVDRALAKLRGDLKVDADD